MATQPVSREARGKSKPAKQARKPALAVEPPPKRTATLRDLRYNFKEIDAGLEAGSAFEITRRGKVIAELRPQPDRAKPKQKIAWPDFEARAKEMFGDRMFAVSTAELLAEGRERF